MISKSSENSWTLGHKIPGSPSQKLCFQKLETYSTNDKIFIYYNYLKIVPFKMKPVQNHCRIVLTGLDDPVMHKKHKKTFL
jgi:hypothetical protein